MSASVEWAAENWATVEQIAEEWEAESSIGFTDYPGLHVLHLSHKGISLNGATVSGWADLSGGGRDTSNSTASKQPTYIAANSDFAGAPSLRFDGIDDYLAYVLNAIASASHDFTSFLVVKSNDAANISRWMWESEGVFGSGPTERVGFVWTRDGVVHSFWDGSTRRPFNGSTPDTAAQYLTMQADSTALTCECWENDVSVGLSATAYSGARVLGENAAIGTQYTMGSSFFAGHMVAIALFTRVLSRSEVGRLQQMIAKGYKL